VLARTAAHPRSCLFPAWPRPICSNTHRSRARTIARGSGNETGMARGNPGRGTRATETPASGSPARANMLGPSGAPLRSSAPTPFRTGVRPGAHTNVQLHRPHPCSYVLTLSRPLSLVRVPCRSPWGVCLRGSIPSAHAGLPRHPNVRGAPSRVRSNPLVLDPVALSLTRCPVACLPHPRNHPHKPVLPSLSVFCIRLFNAETHDADVFYVDVSPQYDIFTLHTASKINK
jgi:hypothetical protein